MADARMTERPMTVFDALARLTRIAERIERIAVYTLELHPDVEANAGDPNLGINGIAGLIWQELEQIRPLVKALVR